MTADMGHHRIRYAHPDDVEEVARLWCKAFPSSQTVEDRVRMLEAGGRYGGLDTVLVARDRGGALTGACKLYRLTQYLTAVAMPMLGLAAVAVAPSARRRGLGARLCRHAMEAARERGDVVSTLYPFRPGYYQRLGWGLVGELHDYRFRTDALPAYGEARHVRPAGGPADAAAIAACYARVAARSNGPIARDERVWAYRLAGEELGVRPLARGRAQGEAGAPTAGAAGGRSRDSAMVFESGEITGYALLRVAGGTAPGGGRVLVRELVAETEEAYRGLLGFLSEHAAAWPEARHAARVEERFGARLSELRPPGLGRARSLYFPTARIIRGPMLRILDAPGALALRRYFQGGREPPAEVVVEIRVRDPHLADNGGPWRLRISGQRALVEPGTGPAQARMTADASAFARIFAGDIPPGDAVRVGGVELAGDAALLDAAFAPRDRFWLLDEF
jgi:predicted acetyltransferase